LLRQRIEAVVEAHFEASVEECGFVPEAFFGKAKIEKISTEVTSVFFTADLSRPFFYK